jgi:hypothetical protein
VLLAEGKNSACTASLGFGFSFFRNASAPLSVGTPAVGTAAVELTVEETVGAAVATVTVGAAAAVSAAPVAVVLATGSMAMGMSVDTTVVASPLGGELGGQAGLTGDPGGGTACVKWCANTLVLSAASTGSSSCSNGIVCSSE